ncbi:hypothetical protein ACQZ4Z_12920 [Agrobacterium vitis]|uniref:hypothetical protein n=1 Tax=Agrobacterium vitis TaxID=373 RepID=UPI001572EE99|nr:hypothetical protein [Agrobacterium vitis]NSZ42817.1 hypothetical protein [Agrobacterium vitis]
MNEHARFQRFCCPTCGGDLGEAPTVQAITPQITKRLRPVLKAIADAGVVGVSMEDLALCLWGAYAARHGGPNRLKVYIHELRREIERFGYYIPKNAGGGGNKGLYRLLPLEVGQ